MFGDFSESDKIQGQTRVESYQELQKWFLLLPSLALSTESFEQ